MEKTYLLPNEENPKTCKVCCSHYVGKTCQCLEKSKKEFENDLNEIFEELFDRVFHEDDVIIFKSFIEKWGPK